MGIGPLLQGAIGHAGGLSGLNSEPHDVVSATPSLRKQPTLSDKPDCSAQWWLPHILSDNSDSSYDAEIHHSVETTGARSGEVSVPPLLGEEEGVYSLGESGSGGPLPHRRALVLSPPAETVDGLSSLLWRRPQLSLSSRSVREPFSSGSCTRWLCPFGQYESLPRDWVTE